MLWTEGRWPMGHLPFFNMAAVQRNHHCPATQALHQVGVKWQIKESAGHQEGHGVSFGHGSTVTMAETNPVPMTQAEGHVAAHLHTRGRQHAPNAEAFCPSLTVIPHPMQYSETTRPPFPSRYRFGMLHWRTGGMPEADGMLRHQKGKRQKVATVCTI